ncbi:MAG: Fur family transcriptional regulator [Candidatus Saccharibacteria bacterium]|jgi:Fur family ferric uptake transcriptional regulator|nr:Fur family transcriptional regulator [Candidatus Saccharibacteria bacterium]
MTVAEIQLQQHLKKAGFSLTNPRKTVFSALQDREPQTMAELVTSCGNNLDRASVYRTIELFEQLGIVQKLHVGWKYRLELTDAFSHHHHHMTCLRCGTITAFSEDAELENRLHKLAEFHNFKPQDHQIEMRGLCHNCQVATRMI